MSAVTGINLFRLLLNIIFFALRSFFTLTNSAYPDEMPRDGISPVCECKKHVPKNIFHNWNAAEYLFKSYVLFHTCMQSLVLTCKLVNSMFLRPIWLFLASIFHQAQVNGQWKHIRRLQLMQANIAGTQLLKIILMQRRYGADMEFKHERPYLVLIIHVLNY